MDVLVSIQVDGFGIRSHLVLGIMSSFFGCVLGIRLVHSKPYSPEGRGKQERANRYIREAFLAEATHVGAFLPFELDLTGLKLRGVNRLIVRVDNRLTAGDLPPGPYGSEGSAAVGGWWNYGGILGDVYLRPVRQANLEQVIVRPELPFPACAATVDEQALVTNVTGAPIRVRLRGSFGTRAVDFGAATIAAGATWTARAQVRVPHPRLWAPGSPALYRASLALSGSSGQQLAGYVTYSGIRSIKVTAGGLLELNGRRLSLRGVGLQESNLQTGGALSPAQIEQLIAGSRHRRAT